MPVAVVAEQVRAGEVVTIGPEMLRLWRGEIDWHPSGQAARDMERGELVFYDPSHNTKDVLVKSIKEEKKQ